MTVRLFYEAGGHFRNEGMVMVWDAILAVSAVVAAIGAAYIIYKLKSEGK